MSTTLPTNRYSANLALSLVVGGRTIKLAQVAPDFVVLAEAVELAPCEAEVHVEVDGHLHRRRVFLIDGLEISKTRTRVKSLST